jgi:subtilisin family serine protease
VLKYFFYPIKLINNMYLRKGSFGFLLWLIAMTMFVSCQEGTDTVNITEEEKEISSRNKSLEQQFVPNEILIKFKEGTNSNAKSKALETVKGTVAEEIVTEAMKRANLREGVTLLRIPMAAMDAINKLKGMPEIEYAEPNWIYNHFATSNDTYFINNSLWGMSAGGNNFGSGAATAWANNKIGSHAVYIGIIDEGYMYTHEDLVANAGTNTGEIAGNGVDDDGNGLKDDVYGWDFDGNNNTVFDGVNDDHGTHVAGTIGGVGGNGKGVAGVVWNVKLLNAKFLGSRGGTTANAIKAVDYFTGLKNKGINIVATNNSWGGGGFSQALKDAIDRANTAGILFIAAAGNSGTNNDATASYPSGYTSANVIAVASITNTGGLSSFSQYGATTVDLGAPGSGIWSTVPKRVSGSLISSYASYNGTSMATPHVSGAAALYASINPGATAVQIKAALLNSAIPTASLTGKCVTGGRLNVTTY